MHLLLGKADKLFEIKDGLNADPFNEFICKIRISPDKLFVSVNINKAGGGILNGSSRKMMAAVNIDPGAENIFNRFDKAKDQVFPYPSM